jgi:hypothetical protein
VQQSDSALLLRGLCLKLVNSTAWSARDIKLFSRYRVYLLDTWTRRLGLTSLLFVLLPRARAVDVATMSISLHNHQLGHGFCQTDSAFCVDGYCIGELFRVEKPPSHSLSRMFHASLRPEHNPSHALPSSDADSRHCSTKQYDTASSTWMEPFRHSPRRTRYKRAKCVSCVPASALIMAVEARNDM